MADNRSDGKGARCPDGPEIFKKVSRLCIETGIAAGYFPGFDPGDGHYLCGDIFGNPSRGMDGGGPFAILDTAVGAWRDRATGENGGDFVSLVAVRCFGGDMGAALKHLLDELGLISEKPMGLFPGTAATPSRKPKPMTLFRPPFQEPQASELPQSFGGTLVEPSLVSTYLVFSGKAMTPCFWNCRYELPNGAEAIRPWVFAKDFYGKGPQLCMKSVPSEFLIDGMPGVFRKPLFNLGDVRSCAAGSGSGGASVLVVEGEKCCAKVLQKDGNGVNRNYRLIQSSFMNGNHFVLTTWSGGRRAADETDWSPLASFRNVLVWVDNDQGGADVGRRIETVLNGLRSPAAPPVVVFQMDAPVWSRREPKGYNVADWLDDMEDSRNVKTAAKTPELTA